VNKIIIFLFCLIISSLNAKIINQIAYQVNDDIITTYDINAKMQQSGLSKAKVINLLIEQALFKQQLSKYNIQVSDEELNEQIKKIAARNNMGFASFMKVINNNPKYASFLDELKSQLEHRKLVEILSRGNIAIANDEDLRIYYNNHKKEFKKPNSVSGVLYSSINERALLAQISNPMLRQHFISTKKIKTNIKNLSPQLQYLVLNTPNNTFTQIYQENSKLHTLYILKKTYLGVLPFNQIKTRIFEIVMQKRQNDFLKDYFDTLKAKADIKKLLNN